MNTSTYQPSPGSIASTISANAARLSEALNTHMRNSFQPESRKTLRKFHPAEVSELTGISMSNLRTRHQEGDFPEVETDARGRRLYTAEEIDTIRKVMARTGRNGEAYLPGRRDGDGLQVISVVNFKGGSSKTTSAIHLAQRYTAWLPGFGVGYGPTGEPDHDVWLPPRDRVFGNWDDLRCFAL